MESVFICGVAGIVETKTSKRFLESVPDAQPEYLDEGLTICANQPLTVLDNGLCWEPALDGLGTDWVGVAETRFAAGLIKTNDGWILFNDALGAHPLYFRVVSGSTFFANRLAPFLNLPGRMHVDWGAWADIFQFGAPLGDSTQFEEIRRLSACRGLQFIPGEDPNEIAFEATHLSMDGNRPSASDVVDAVRDALPRRSLLQRPPAITLSGGWDSRLLAALARGRYTRRPRAWTVSQDDGTEDDTIYAEKVAKELRLPQTVVPPDDTPWSEIATEARLRMDYQTWLHPWLVPLRRQMESKGGDVLDGLAGDVLIKGLFVDSELLGAGPKEQTELLFQRLGGGAQRYSGRFTDDFAGATAASTKRRFTEISDQFLDHPNHLALTVLHSRTARAIALSPLRLFGPELGTWLPFVDPTVLGTLSIPPEEKTDGRLYRNVLQAGAASVAGLPSTNDGLAPLPSSIPSRQGSAEAVAWIAGSVLESDLALSMLSPRLRSSVEEEGANWNPPDLWTSRFLQVVSLFAQWEVAHRDTLVDASLPT
jgi:hypothetical protein